MLSATFDILPVAAGGSSLYLVALWPVFLPAVCALVGGILWYATRFAFAQFRHAGRRASRPIPAHGRLGAARVRFHASSN